MPCQKKIPEMVKDQAYNDWTCYPCLADVLRGLPCYLARLLWKLVIVNHSFFDSVGSFWSIVCQWVLIFPLSTRRRVFSSDVSTRIDLIFFKEHLKKKTKISRLKRKSGTKKVQFGKKKMEKWYWSSKTLGISSHSHTECVNQGSLTSHST